MPSELISRCYPFLSRLWHTSRKIKNYFYHQKLKINFLHDYFYFKRLERNSVSRFFLYWSDRYPCLYDKTDQTDFGRHYVYHTAWAGRVLAATKPSNHIDISSCLRFVSIASAFVHIDFFDYRPAKIELDNVTSNSADITALPFKTGSIHSLSSMHVVEHIGLGRYGDPFDYEGDIKAIAELKRVLAPGGNLLFVVPIGKPRIQFNAHRIYSYAQIREYFADLHLNEFVLIPDDPRDGGLVANPSADLINRQMFGCGCFWFIKCEDNT